jgi:cell division protein FtsL
MCAIALSLAYPVREYIAQRREIGQLGEQQKFAQQQVQQLSAEQQRLGNESYIKGEARRRLHMCDPNKNCYVVLNGGGDSGQDAAHSHTPAAPPWYVTLWRSVGASDRQR